MSVFFECLFPRLCPLTTVSAGVIVVLCAGCPEPDSNADCDREGEGAFTLFTRDGSEQLQANGVLEVFPPPQGGVFTELDLRITGIREQNIQSLRIDIIASGGDPIAGIRYPGEALPWTCESDGTLLFDNVPIGFDLDVTLGQLDGTGVTLAIELVGSGVGGTSVPLQLAQAEY